MPGSVVGAWWVHDKQALTGDGELFPLVLPDTLLGPEATGPCGRLPLLGVWVCRPPGWGVVVVALLLVVGCGV